MRDSFEKRVAGLPVELRVRARDLGRPDEGIDALCRNIGAGGLFVETSVGFSIGTLVQLEVSTGPDRPAIRLVAEVVRVEEPRGELGSRDTTSMRTRGVELRLRKAEASEVERLLRAVGGGLSTTLEEPSPLARSRGRIED